MSETNEKKRPKARWYHWVLLGMAVTGYVITQLPQSTAQTATPPDSSNAQTCVNLSHINYSYENDIQVSHVTGVLNQTCAASIGVELQWTGYYADGSVAFSTTFFPNGSSNIPKNVDFPFDEVQSGQIAPTRYSLTVSNLQDWNNQN